ncbi:unnamed protein product [Allacma fusca]|uniref:Uncharacterized protein n=1 Tax=Allacma fusca TaxID=39272 RepID=A0A8J2P157_9HEXA|nr:unnamed protein product [Allacma fusca]
MCECLSRVEMSGLFLLKLEIFGFLDPARVDLSRVEGQDVSEVTNNIFRELMELQRLYCRFLLLRCCEKCKIHVWVTDTLTKKATMTLLQHSVDRINESCLHTSYIDAYKTLRSFRIEFRKSCEHVVKYCIYV